MARGEENVAMNDKPEKEPSSSADTAARENWSGRLDFVMSALSFAVGMGNLWRFPYLCYKNGGGAFLIPYIISMILCGYPLMFIELALGQYGARGVVQIWKACPLFEGIGWGMIGVSVFTGIYYNMIVAWCIFYIVASFNADVPWRHCGNSWNEEGCTTGDDRSKLYSCGMRNGTWYNNTCYERANVTEEEWSYVTNASSLIKKTSPSEDFFNNYMLGVSGGFHDMGGIRWQLALCFLFCWLVVFVSLAKGIKVSGKVTYVTALFPYLVLSILLVRGLTLEGSARGIIYYLRPEWDKLLSPQVWGDAAIQAFFSLSLCWGGLITLASYNKFNNNCLRDAIVIATGDMLTSIFGGFVIFSILGYMSFELQLPMDQVVSKGPGLAFIVYPEAVTKLPISQLWSILFMLVLVNVGLGSQMGLVSCVHTSVVEVFEKHVTTEWRRVAVLFAICVTFFMLGLSMTTNGGVYMLLLMDSYASTYCLLFIDFIICIAIGWVYGWRRFYKDIEQMLGYRISYWWMICWKFIDPALIVFILTMVLIDFKRSSYRDYEFPVEWEVMGWFITIIPVLCVPALAIFKLLTLHPHLSIKSRLSLLCKPASDWGPVDDTCQMQTRDQQDDVTEKMNTEEKV